MNAMRRCLVTYGLVLFFVVGLCPGAVAEDAVGAAAVSDEDQSLRSLVRSYVQESSRQSPDELLPKILNHPGANLETVEAAIRDQRDGRCSITPPPRTIISGA